MRLVLLAPLALCACLEARVVNVSASFAAAQIEAWNRAGVDPIQVSPESQARMALACGTVAGIAAIVRPNNTEAQAAIQSFCALVTKAAGKGSA